MALSIYAKHENAAFKMPWIILILAFPVLGLGMYLLFGRKEATRLVRERFERAIYMLHRHNITAVWSDGRLVK